MRAPSMHTPAGRREWACDTSGCDRAGAPVRVVDGEAVRREGVRCAPHTKQFLEVSS